MDFVVSIEHRSAGYCMLSAPILAAQPAKRCSRPPHIECIHDERNFAIFMLQHAGTPAWERAGTTLFELRRPVHLASTETQPHTGVHGIQNLRRLKHSNTILSSVWCCDHLRVLDQITSPSIHDLNASTVVSNHWIDGRYSSLFGRD